MANYMRTEFYVRDDIENILRAINRANRDLSSLLGSAEVDLYRAGFVAALQALAEAFNVQFETADTAPDDSSRVILIEKALLERKALTAPNR